MIASIGIPYFTAAVIERDQPERVGQAFRVGNQGVSTAAAQLGVQAGMTEAEAQATYSAIVTIPYDGLRQGQARREVEDILLNYSPQLEPTERPRWYIDMGKLHARDALGLIRLMVNDLHTQTGFGASVGLAAGKFPALVANIDATVGSGLLIPPPQAGRFLAPHPLSYLPLEPGMYQHLQHLGIRTIGDFAALPRGAIATQYGKAGVLAHDLAHGQDERPLIPKQSREVLTYIHQCEPAVDNYQTVEAIIFKEARGIARELRKRQAASRELTLALHLENGELVEAQRILAEPVSGVEMLRQQLKLLLGQLSISASVAEIVIAVSDFVAPQAFQLSLFGDHAERAAELEASLRHLAKRYGQDTFYRVTLTDPEHVVPEQRFRIHGLDFT